MYIFESSQNRGRAFAAVSKLLRVAAACFLAGQLAFPPLGSAADNKPTSTPLSAPTPVSANDPVLKAMQTELSRAVAELGKAEQPPYYLSYTVYDQDFVVLSGAYGSLLGNTSAQRRFADVTMRVGVPRSEEHTSELQSHSDL